jgi:hypothetical protein
MKRFASTVCFCVFLLVAGFWFILPSTEARDNVLQNLLDLPAPPPNNPFYQVGSTSRRTKDFYSKKNPPGDDATTEDLLEYWKWQSESYRELGYNIKPTGKSLDRILSEVADKPESLLEYLKILPEDADTADFVKRIYENSKTNEDLEEYWRDAVETWLLYHNKDYSEQLGSIVQQSAGDAGEYVGGLEPLLSLVHVDWDRAQPIVQRLYNDSSQRTSQVMARWALYRHALETDSFGDIEKYRDELKAIVEDKNATDGQRDLAIDALVKEKDFAGRDDWYFGLLEDETLDDLRVDGRSYTGLTTIIYYSPPEKYADKMIELLKSDNKAVRTAAIRNLTKIMNSDYPEVIRALLPWLEDPQWATEVGGERQAIITALENVQIPESVPGLLVTLNEKETRPQMPRFYPNSNVAIPYPSNMPSNMTTNSVTTYPLSMTETYPLRYGTISALEKQKDARAAASLRAILPQVDEWQRIGVVRALLMSNGFSIPEQIEAVEATAKATITTDSGSNTAVMSNANTYYGGNTTIPMPRIDMDTIAVSNMSNSVYTKRPYNPADIKPILGNLIVNNPEPNADFVKALIERIRQIETKDPQTAGSLRKIMLNWHGAAINSLLMSDLKANSADVNAIVKLLAVRKELREKQSNEVFELRTSNKTAIGISACILEDRNEYEAILSGEDIETKIALLGCARMIRAEMSLQTVAANLKSSNKMLALAAERYLESEDSPDARQIVLALHPNEAKILGATTHFAGTEEDSATSNFLPDLFASVSDAYTPENYFYLQGYIEEIMNREKLLQKEIKESKDLLGIYWFDKNFVRIYSDRAVFSREENDARYRERVLTAEEFDNLKTFLVSQRVNELPAFLSYCNECEAKELLMLGRQGGRRVFVKTELPPPFFKELDQTFEQMSKAPTKLRYYLEKDVSGLEILFSDDVLQARTLWKSGEDFRVLIDDTSRREQIDKELALQDKTDETSGKDIDYEKLEETRRKRREQREFENFSWQKLDKEKLTGLADQPAQAQFLPIRDSFPVRAQAGRWKAQTANIEIRADEQGLYKITGGALSKIKTGYYRNPVVTSNGRWAIAAKVAGEEQGTLLVRVNLQTNREYPVKLDDYPSLEAVVYVAAINKVVVSASTYYEEEEGEPQYFLLDPDTGVVSEAADKILPLAQQEFRSLQAAANPNEFWAAISNAEPSETQVGIYNAKTLSFKPVMKVPRVEFDSMSMWIDAGRVYFIYEGHVLSLPLPK